MNARLQSLDAFRGFTIAAMLLVNNPGDWGHLYGPLAHAEWHGWTFTDWVFPFFVFISGMAMTMSLSRRAALGDDKLKLIAHELLMRLRESVTVDWSHREPARARMRVLVRRILRKYGYPPDLQDSAVQTVLQQAEALSELWSVSATPNKKQR